MKKIIITTLFLLGLTACDKQTYIMSSQRGVLVHEYNNSFLFGGIGQTEDNDPVKMCAGKTNITKIETEQTLGNGLVSFVTFSIYTPMNVKIYCKEDRFNNNQSTQGAR